MAVMKRQRVIREFKHYVNMSPEELEEWLKTEQSNTVGWSSSGKGESVGHSSGRQIVRILRQDGDDYSEDQVKHMQKVAGYCKRHLGQAPYNANKSTEEIKQSNFYASLKNWGHDYLKGTSDEGESDPSDEEKEEEDEEEVDDQKQNGSRKKNGSKQDDDDGDVDQDMAEDEKAEAEEDDKTEADEDKEAANGQKRQHSEVESGDDDEKEPGDGESKRAKTSARGRPRGRVTRGRGARGGGGARSTRSTRSNPAKDEDEGGGEEKDEENKEDDKDDNKNGTAKKKGTKADADDDKNESSDKASAGPSKGDTVSWPWGGGHPKGKVLDVKQDAATITTKNGNKVSRNGSSEDPAVVLDAGRSKAIKLSHELD